jgi:hypothetical protein
LFKLLTSTVGSITVHPHDDESIRAVELGASIFVEANRNLVKVADVSGRVYSRLATGDWRLAAHRSPSDVMALAVALGVAD